VGALRAAAGAGVVAAAFKVNAQSAFTLEQWSSGSTMLTALSDSTELAEVLSKGGAME